MGSRTAYVGAYKPADNEVFDQQLNDNADYDTLDSAILVEHNGWTAHAAAAAPHSGHASLVANTYTGTQTLTVAADGVAVMLDPGPLVAAGTQFGSRLRWRAHAYDLADHQRDFTWRARTTSNAGNGNMDLVTLLNGAGQATVFTVDQAGNAVLLGGLAFSTAASRITGDFSNGVFASRVAFQTSTPNSTTSMSALSNGTSTVSEWVAYAGNDPTNAPFAQFGHNGGVAYYVSGANGAGTMYPLVMYTGGAERLRIASTGQIGINMTPTVPGPVLQATGNANQAVCNLLASTTSGQSYGLYVVAGTVVGDWGFQIANRAATTGVIYARGDGQVVINSANIGLGASTQTLVVNAGTNQNNYAAAINGAQTSGNSYGLTISAAYTSADAALWVGNRPGTTSILIAYGTGVQLNGSQTLVGANSLLVYGQTAQYAHYVVGAAVSGSSYGVQIQAGYTGGDVILTVGTHASNNVISAYANGTVQLNPSATNFGTTAFSVTGSPNSFTASITGWNAANVSYGLSVTAGTAGDTALSVVNRSGSIGFFTIYGNQSMGLNGGLSNTYTGASFFGYQLSNTNNAGGQGMAYAWATYSSQNLKSAVKVLGEDGTSRALDLLHSINGVRYLHHTAVHRRAKVGGRWDWVVDHNDTPSIGFVAEEVMQYLPEVVARDEAGNIGLDYGRMLTVAWQAIKELTARVATLESRGV